MMLLTGSTGFIGKHYKEMFPDKLLCPSHSELDLTDQDEVKDYLMDNKPEKIIHCGSNDHDVCLYDNLRMFYNLAESGIPMITFCTGREVEDRSYKNGEYVLSKRIIKELALSKYNHITVIQLWGCFGAYEKDIRFFKKNMIRIKQGHPILISEDRMFSYVYVKDVARIINSLIKDDEIGKPCPFMRLVAYNDLFSNYAATLGRVAGAEDDVIIEKEALCNSYIGKNNCDFRYTPLDEALEEMWKEVKCAKS
jgi:dTDP-4-dehydrorhamnose reductase